MGRYIDIEKIDNPETTLPLGKNGDAWLYDFIRETDKNWKEPRYEDSPGYIVGPETCRKLADLIQQWVDEGTPEKEFLSTSVEDINWECSPTELVSFLRDAAEGNGAQLN